jgi:hypothetical protein
MLPNLERLAPITATAESAMTATGTMVFFLNLMGLSAFTKPPV